MFVAEAPGETEVDLGKPLVGKAGTFLRRVIKDLGMDENRCYFTNTCLCRPEGNKKPNAKAMQACFRRLLREIKLVQPKLIVTLGGVPTSALLRPGRGITGAHGVYKELKFKSGLTIGALPTFHPSGVLRGTEFFPDFVDDLDFARRIVAGETPVEPPPYHNYHIVDTQEGFEEFLKLLHQQRFAACDIETDKTKWTEGVIMCVGFSWARGTAWILDWPVLLDQNLDNLHGLDEALKGVPLSFQNGMYDVPFLLHQGMQNVWYYFDTMLAHYVLDERQGTHGLEKMAVKYYKAPAWKWAFRKLMGIKGHVDDDKFALAVSKVPKHDLFMYNGADVDYTYRLTVDLAKQVKAEGLMHVLRDIEMPAARLFMEFTMSGMLVDQEYWKAMARGWRDEIKALEKQIREYPGIADINIGSTKQLAKLLFDEMGLLPFGGEKSFGKKKIDEQDIARAIREVSDPEARDYWTSQRTQMSEGLKGFGGEAKGLSPRSTTTYMLYYLKQQHPLPGLIIRWRFLRKRYGMYYTGLKKHLWKDGRVHPEYRMTATRTGRKASEHPAMHNLPRGDMIYNIYIADPGWVDIHADYMTAEMRMMAHYSGDKHLLHIVDTSDIHTEFAKQIFHLTQEQVDAMPKDELKDKRIASKMITFGIPYGRSAAGLAPQLGVDKDEAEQYIKTFFKMFAPRLEKWLKYQRAKGVKEQLVISASGRRRRFPFIRDKYHRREVERQVGNFVIQTTINEMTMVAECKSIERLRAAGIPCKPWPHIHDSLNILVPKPLWKPAVEIIVATMAEVPFPTEVNFPSEVEVGERWGELKTVHKGGKWVSDSYT
jgi:DNA polymerase-1